MKLYFKNWFAKKNYCKEADFAEIYNMFYAGQTEKAVKFFEYGSCGNSVKVVTKFVPKSALIACETEEEFRELDKKENSEKALESVNKYLETETSYTFQEAVKFANLQYDAYL